MPFYKKPPANAITTNSQATLSDLDVDDGTLSIDETNNRVGVGLIAPKTRLTVEGAITLKEQAAADTDSEAYGQLWVKTATPNELYFTTDAGDDIQITTGTSTAGGGGGGAVNLASGVTGILGTANGGTGVSGLAQIATVGALDAGSITSNFGAINNGASGYTTTGAINTGTVVAAQNTSAQTLPITVTNQDNSSNSDAAVGYGFNLARTDELGVESAKILAKKKETYTGDTATHNAKLEFYVTKNGTQAKQMTLQGGNELRFSNSNSSLTVADSSGDNQAGKNLVIEAGAGTGSGVPGSFEVKVTAPTGTAADVQTHNTAIKCTGDGVSIYTGAGLAGLANDSGFGEIVYWGAAGSDTLAAGRLCYLNSSGQWMFADADTVGTASNLLGICLGANVTDGILIKGYFKLNTYVEGSFVKGAPCYISEEAGEVDFSIPGTGDTVRIIGHGTAETNVILFNGMNPTYLEL